MNPGTVLDAAGALPRCMPFVDTYRARRHIVYARGHLLAVEIIDIVFLVLQGFSFARQWLQVCERVCVPASAPDLKEIFAQSHHALLRGKQIYVVSSLAFKLYILVGPAVAAKVYNEAYAVYIADVHASSSFALFIHRQRI
jgi:hypothetical protein